MATGDDDDGDDDDIPVMKSFQCMGVFPTLVSGVPSSSYNSVSSLDNLGLLDDEACGVSIP